MKSERIVTAGQMKEIDDAAINRYGIPRLVLMEHAGMAVAKEAARMLAGRRSKRVAAFIGPGSNGGDGCVAVRHLVNRGAICNVYTVGDESRMSEETAIHVNALRKLGLPVMALTDSVLPTLARQVADAELLIDALLGTGLSGPVREPYRRIIDILNETGKPILSVDVPSGLDATTGQAMGSCIHASRTITMGLMKRGLTIGQGVELAGVVTVADITFPKQLLRPS